MSEISRIVYILYRFLWHLNIFIFEYSGFPFRYTQNSQSLKKPLASSIHEVRFCPPLQKRFIVASAWVCLVAIWFLDRIEDVKTSAMGEPEVGSEGVDHLRPEQPHPPLQLQPRCLLACHRWDSCCIFSLITHTHTHAHTYHISIQDLFITRQDSIQYTYSGFPRILWSNKFSHIHY